MGEEIIWNDTELVRIANLLNDTIKMTQIHAGWNYEQMYHVLIL